jgi:hypothetical protein
VNPTVGVSGKGRNLDSNRFGYLVATDEEPLKVCFLTLGLFGANSRLLKIEGFKAGLEQRFLSDELHIYSPGEQPALHVSLRQRKRRLGAASLSNAREPQHGHQAAEPRHAHRTALIRTVDGERPAVDPSGCLSGESRCRSWKLRPGGRSILLLPQPIPAGRFYG